MSRDEEVIGSPAISGTIFSTKLLHRSFFLMGVYVYILYSKTKGRERDYDIDWL
jgi:hypothetical protein